MLAPAEGVRPHVLEVDAKDEVQQRVEQSICSQWRSLPAPREEQLEEADAHLVVLAAHELVGGEGKGGGAGEADSSASAGLASAAGEAQEDVVQQHRGEEGHGAGARGEDAVGEERGDHERERDGGRR